MASTADAGDLGPGTLPGGYAVETAGLVKRFGDRTAVDRVELRVPPGWRLGIWGRTARARPR